MSTHLMDLPPDELRDLEQHARNFWVTQDRKVIAYKKMSDGHLENTIKFLASRGYAAHREVEEATKKGEPVDPVAKATADLCRIHPITVISYNAMLEEKKRREKIGIQVPETKKKKT